MIKGLEKDTVNTTNRQASGEVNILFGFNPFPQTTNLQQTIFNTYWQNSEYLYKYNFNH